MRISREVKIGIGTGVGISFLNFMVLNGLAQSNLYVYFLVVVIASIFLSFVNSKIVKN